MAAAAAKKDSRYKTWRDRLSPDQRKELDDVRESFRSGDLNLSARSLAKAILDDFAASGGEPLCSLHTLSQWLLER